MNEWQCKAINELKAAGRVIIDNTEEMISSYNYQTENIDIHIKISSDKPPQTEFANRLILDDLCTKE